MGLGLALVPEDRRKQGLVIDSTVGRNITTAIRRACEIGLITTGMENESAQIWASRLEVKTRALDAVAGTLSGGNQQKVCPREMAGHQAESADHRRAHPRHRRRHQGGGAPDDVELAGQGLGILMISSELPRCWAWQTECW